MVKHMINKYDNMYMINNPILTATGDKYLYTCFILLFILKIV